MASRKSYTNFPAAQPFPGNWGRSGQAFLASYAQSRLWFLHQLDPTLTAYHLLTFWQLRGDLDIKALSQALTALIERHPTLRSSFQLHGSEVLQILHPPVPFHVDFEHLGYRDFESVIQAWQQQEASTPFDLTSGLLIRARVLAVDDQHYLFLLNHHHIASDGWSRSVLTRDLAELYNSQRAHRPPEILPLTVQYHDYATCQHERLSGQYLGKLKNYWIPQLTELEPLELPTDHPRLTIPSNQGGSVSFQIEPGLLALFETLCRAEGATLQMGLIAIIGLLMHRYSRQDDIVIGIPHWGRNEAGSRIKAARPLLGIVGFFINTLPIRSLFNQQRSFRELLQQIKATCLEAYDHHELPFEQMVEALNLERDTSRNPLVQVMVQLIEFPPASLDNLDGLEVEQVSATSETSKLDLSFYLRRSTDQGLNGSITYATDLFCADRIERLSEHLLTLLASALQFPDAPAASLTLLPETERLLIESWQHGPTNEIPDLCVHQLFEQQVQRTPEAIALIIDDQQLTYRDLNARAN